MAAEKSVQLEAAIRELTHPINGQYLRPWMTNLADPASARVFTVGMNPHGPFDVSTVSQKLGTHEQYVDALFNRGPVSCHQLYELVRGKSSQTRATTNKLVDELFDLGIRDVLQTNVTCYATSESRCLRQPEHRPGRDAGLILFQTIAGIIKPRVLIVHGSGAAKYLSRALHAPALLPPKRNEPSPPVERLTTLSTVRGHFEALVIAIPSLSPRPYNVWRSFGWAECHLDAVSERVAKYLGRA